MLGKQKKKEDRDIDASYMRELIMNFRVHEERGLDLLEVKYPVSFQVTDVVMHNSFEKDKIRKYVVKINRLCFNFIDQL